MSLDAKIPEAANRFKRHPWFTLAMLGILAVILLEIGLRVAALDIVQFVRQARQVHRYSSRWKVDLVPNTVAHMLLRDAQSTPYLNFVITTDADGLRTYDRPRDHGWPPSTAGTKYIHAIGDSFTMGWGVDYTSSYPALLDALLPPDYRVLNEGVDGFGTLAATEKAMTLWSRYPATHVVYLFSPNDFDDDETALAVRQRWGITHAAFHGLDVARRHLDVANIAFALKWYRVFHSHAASRALADKRLVLQEQVPPVLTVRTPAPLPPEMPPNASMRQIERFQQFVKGKQARLTVLVLDDGAASRRFYHFCHALGINTVQIEMHSEGVLVDEGHFNAAGNLALAHLVRSSILR
jgi:GDSL-like lipase/acylhydrolase family protein